MLWVFTLVSNNNLSKYWLCLCLGYSILSHTGQVYDLYLSQKSLVCVTYSQIVPYLIDSVLISGYESKDRYLIMASHCFRRNTQTLPYFDMTIPKFRSTSYCYMLKRWAVNSLYDNSEATSTHRKDKSQWNTFN